LPIDFLGFVSHDRLFFAHARRSRLCLRGKSPPVSCLLRSHGIGFPRMIATDRGGPSEIGSRWCSFRPKIPIALAECDSVPIPRGCFVQRSAGSTSRGISNLRCVRGRRLKKFFTENRASSASSQGALFTFSLVGCRSRRAATREWLRWPFGQRMSMNGPRARLNSILPGAPIATCALRKTAAARAGRACPFVQSEMPRAPGMTTVGAPAGEGVFSCA
jgi:hypothetical protein